MCVGIPMQIEATDGIAATCVAEGRTETVDMSLVGPQPQGTWVLVFLGAAREVLSPEAARQITKALDGLAAAMRGEGFADAFHDLESREPQLPPHLEAARRAGARTA